MPHMIDRVVTHKLWRLWYGGAASGSSDSGADFDVASPGGVKPARRSGSSSGDFAVLGWLDERPAERRLRGGCGQRPSLAGLVQRGWRRCTASVAATGARSNQGRFGGFCCN